MTLLGLGRASKLPLLSLCVTWLGRESSLSLLSLYATFDSDAANLLETNTNLP